MNLVEGLIMKHLVGGEGGGVQPSGTLSISANGMYDVTNYASASVNVGGGTSELDALLDGSITRISSNATHLVSAAFANLPNLIEINVPNVSTCAATPFSNLSAINRINLPALTVFGNSSSAVIQSCNSLKILDLGVVTNITLYSLTSCPALDTVIIRSSSVASLGGVSVFNSTCFKSGGSASTLYVPSALISAYSSSSPWTTLLGRDNVSIAAIEGSIYE